MGKGTLATVLTLLVGLSPGLAGAGLHFQVRDASSGVKFVDPGLQAPTAHALPADGSPLRFALPFAVTLDGETYRTIEVSAHGWARLIDEEPYTGPRAGLSPVLAAPRGASLSNTSHLMFSVFTVLFAVGLGLVARGLWQGLSWPRTAAVVWLVLLLPVGWAMVQAGRGLVGALILGSAAVGIAAVAAESRMAARS